MIHIVDKLSNGDGGYKCEAEKWCSKLAYQLSSSERPVGAISQNGTQTYERTIRYKCGNGHRFDKVANIKKDLLEVEE